MEDYHTVANTLATLLAAAWLLPLLGFLIEVFAGYWGHRLSKAAAYIAVFCIGAGFVCSVSATCYWGNQTNWAVFAQADDHHGDEHHGEEEHGHEKHADAEKHEGEDHDAENHDKADHDHEKEVAHEGETDEHESVPTAFSGTFYVLGAFGDLRISLDYYIDSLTLTMFMMVTLIATCIHIFAIGYMSDELTESYEDHFVHTSDGGHFHRPGRFYRFFSYLSLFCFSMLGLVLAGNIFQVFIFWELVGICSYLLIGFYVERKSANVAANKAFIMNRVGDFGFLIGLMVLWTWCGTFQFDDYNVGTAEDPQMKPGLFQMVRGDTGQLDIEETDDAKAVVLHGVDGHHLTTDDGKSRTIPYMLLVVAGLGVFAGCVGKSAQFPLQTWLPDAMEGPTPVSALVHSATMVAAGVYLVGRFYPVFTPEVLLTIAYTGCITLFVAATIAVVATDIKQVLAYSTISQLGYMMLGLGVGGWGAGLFHLITHAFFKSLMFLSSGSVIAGCHHEQEMPRMGGLLKKMPITGFAMLVGVIAISGLAIPGTTIALSGFHSKDEIVATALAFAEANPGHFLLFLMPLITAGITAFYMFRLWFYTFWGKPRDQELHDHVHESPRVMTGPLVVLSVFAAICAVGGTGGALYKMLSNSEPVGVAAGLQSATISLPSHHAIHEVHSEAGIYALMAAFSGLIIAYVLYGAGIINPGEIKKQMRTLHSFLAGKWRFDELYDVMFVRPTRIVARWCAGFDRLVLDGILHGASKLTINVAKIDRKFDETVIDGLVNMVGQVTYSVGRSFRHVQTGKLRQYIMFIAVGVLALFAMLFALFPGT